MFDLSLPKLLVLAVIALVVFGPDELPTIAAQAGRALRDLRQIAEGAKNDLRDGLGPSSTTSRSRTSIPSGSRKGTSSAA
jgi:Sec-independent protein secretion pathway components